MASQEHNSKLKELATSITIRVKDIINEEGHDYIYIKNDPILNILREKLKTLMNEMYHHNNSDVKFNLFKEFHIIEEYHKMLTLIYINCGITQKDYMCSV